MINRRFMCLFDTICNYFGEVILKPKLIKQTTIDYTFNILGVAPTCSLMDLRKLSNSYILASKMFCDYKQLSAFKSPFIKFK